MTKNRKPLGKHRRIVIKIGSALLVDRATGLKKAWLDAMCRDIAALRAGGAVPAPLPAAPAPDTELADRLNALAEAIEGIAAGLERA